MIAFHAIIFLGGAPPVSLLAPASNEEATCIQSVRSLLALEYADYEVLVINDGSKDGTLAELLRAFDLVAAPRSPTAEIATKGRVRRVYRSRSQPTLWVIDKENGGKADALNVGLNYVRTPLFCVMDADSLLERDALARIVRPFLEVRAGMVTKVGLPRSLLARIRVVEYLRSFLAGRVGWDALGATLSLTAIGLEELAFRRYPRTRQLVDLMVVAVIEAVGYHHLSTWWRLRGLWAALRRTLSVAVWGWNTRSVLRPTTRASTGYCPVGGRTKWTMMDTL